MTPGEAASADGKEREAAPAKAALPRELSERLSSIMAEYHNTVRAPTAAAAAVTAEATPAPHATLIGGALGGGGGAATFRTLDEFVKASAAGRGGLSLPLPMMKPLGVKANIRPARGSPVSPPSHASYDIDRILSLKRTPSRGGRAGPSFRARMTGGLSSGPPSSRGSDIDTMSEGGRSGRSVSSVVSSLSTRSRQQTRPSRMQVQRMIDSWRTEVALVVQEDLDPQQLQELRCAAAAAGPDDDGEACEIDEDMLFNDPDDFYAAPPAKALRTPLPAAAGQAPMA